MQEFFQNVAKIIDHKYDRLNVTPMVVKTRYRRH
jgi:hypothetical protein